jgi:hypothetical protein
LNPIFRVDHAKALDALKARLAILKGSPEPRPEDITRLESVIAMYRDRYHSQIIAARMARNGG